MKYLALVLLISVIYPQDIKRTSEFKRGTAYGQDCDDTEYRTYSGLPGWKGYGNWLSECDSIMTVNLDREFAERAKERKQEKARLDSIEAEEFALMDLDKEFDLEVMWENTVWEEIQDVTEVYAEVEQITAVAGVRGAEAEDEALQHLYYRKTMKKLTLIELQKAYGKLKVKRSKLVKQNKPTQKIDKFLIVVENKIKQYTS
jgi:hypothetical protein